MHSALFWFRRDLRLTDNNALYQALKSGYPVRPVFIFDRNLFDRPTNTDDDRRVAFLYRELTTLHETLRQFGAALEVFDGIPADVFKALAGEGNIAAVYANRDYEPYTRRRDEEVGTLLKQYRIPFHTFPDQVIFEPDLILKGDGTPYTVFTPYRNKWKETLAATSLPSFDSHSLAAHFHRTKFKPLPSLRTFGFKDTGEVFPPRLFSARLLSEYEQYRNFPAINGTSRLGIHLHFGTVSIRPLVAMAMQHSTVFLDELIWREFFRMILYHYPQVETRAFKPAYDRIIWRNNPDEFERWRLGQTGYPLVDAGMRELNATGFMHNRVRMVTACFLVKHLLVDWRWGEAWFGEKLLDYDLAANNGNWQWVAGCGCDAAPYFRIFNPARQTLRFDPELTYVRRWVPEYETAAYPAPLVKHETARLRCLEAYKKALAIP